MLLFCPCVLLLDNYNILILLYFSYHLPSSNLLFVIVLTVWGSSYLEIAQSTKNPIIPKQVCYWETLLSEWLNLAFRTLVVYLVHFIFKFKISRNIIITFKVFSGYNFYYICCYIILYRSIKEGRNKDIFSRTYQASTTDQWENCEDSGLSGKAYSFTWGKCIYLLIFNY